MEIEKKMASWREGSHVALEKNNDKWQGITETRKWSRSYCFNSYIPALRQNIIPLLRLYHLAVFSKLPKHYHQEGQESSVPLTLPSFINGSRKLQPPFSARTKEAQQKSPVHAINTHTKSYYGGQIPISTLTIPFPSPPGKHAIKTVEQSGHL